MQSEYGDIYKVTLTYEGESVTELKIKYFDTIPPCTSIAVLKTGFLFAASEYGNHALYQFVVRFPQGAWGFGCNPQDVVPLLCSCCRVSALVVSLVSSIELGFQSAKTSYGLPVKPYGVLSVYPRAGKHASEGTQ